MEKREGDTCECCGRERLRIIRGALVCPTCDAVASWPALRRP